MVLCGKLFYQVERAWKYCIKVYKLSLFKKIGIGVYIGNSCTFTEKTISVGNDVSIEKGCCFQSTHGDIIIGNHVMFGPEVHIHGGNHSVRHIGVYMKEVDYKKPGDDGQVIIEDDCWIGARAIILKGVKVGKGSIIGAGSIVIKDVPPYSIYSGVPSNKMRPRWDEKTIKEHESLLMERSLRNER